MAAGKSIHDQADIRLSGSRKRSRCFWAIVFALFFLSALPRAPKVSAQRPASDLADADGSRSVYPKGTRDSSAANSDQAAKIFHAYCAACHTIGQGRGVGPDLKDVGTRRSADWLTRWISDPDRVLEEKDPTAVALLHQYKMRMPNQHLTSSDVAALVTFLAGSIVAPAPQAAPPVWSGEVAAGKALFTGTVRSKNGGPACMACHSAAGVGVLGGGTMGPDLTKVYTKLGSALTAWPTTMPVMRPMYVAAPLASQEKADLVAFFRSEAAAQPGSPPGAWLFALVSGLAFVLLLGAHLIWRRRLRDVRKALLRRG